MEVERERYLAAVRQALARSPVCALLGPRQCGKTTLARHLAARRRAVHFFDLESGPDAARLATPELTLGSLSGLVIIDEVQRQPDLFRALRPLIDSPSRRARFLLLGSASPDIIRGVSESLAGRVAFVDVAGFDLTEVTSGPWQRLWLRGGFPRAFLARSEAASLAWRSDLIRTFLERDIPQLGVRISSETLRRFWMNVAHYHAQIWNGSELARSLAVSEHTVRGYLDLLSGTFLLRQLPPWHENIAKRQYKAPKVYVRDSGLLHALLSIDTSSSLQGHPKYGASWEGFVLEQILALVGHRDAYYWGTHAGAELDLLLLRRGKRIGFEIKCTDAPRMTKSLGVALDDLGLEQAWIVYPGAREYPVHERVRALPISGLQAALKPWRAL